MNCPNLSTDSRRCTLLPPAIVLGPRGCEACRATWSGGPPEHYRDASFLIDVRRKSSGTSGKASRPTCESRSALPVDRKGCNCPHKWEYACGHAERGGTCTESQCAGCRLYVADPDAPKPPAYVDLKAPAGMIRLTAEQFQTACAPGYEAFLREFPSGVMAGRWDAWTLAFLRGSELGPFVDWGLAHGFIWEPTE